MSAGRDVKITYTTLSLERLEALHDEIDREIERVRERFGAVYPNRIGGRAVSSADGFDDLSPHDTRIRLGRFAQATPGQARDAIAAAGDAFPAWAGQPWRERVAAVRRMADAIRGHRCELAALMGFEAGKNRLECLGDVEETAELIAVLLRRAGAARRLPHRDGNAEPGRREPERHASAWRVGRHLAVQLPARPRRWPGRCGPGRRQHGGAQAGQRHAVAGSHVARHGRGGGPAAPACST